MTFFNAWHLWWQGSLTRDFNLYGLGLLWWGRIGKAVAFIGALTVVLDLIGPDRLRAWGKKVHAKSPLIQRETRVTLKNIWRLPAEFLDHASASQIRSKQARHLEPEERMILYALQAQESEEFREKHPKAGCVTFIIATCLGYFLFFYLIEQNLIPGWLWVLFLPGMASNYDSVAHRRSYARSAL